MGSSRTTQRLYSGSCKGFQADTNQKKKKKKKFFFFFWEADKACVLPNDFLLTQRGENSFTSLSLSLSLALKKERVSERPSGVGVVAQTSFIFPSRRLTAWC